jgi:hypothetical protein
MNIAKYDNLEEIIKLRLQGLTSLQIKENSFQELSQYDFDKLFWQAGERIRDISDNEVLSTRVLHAQRYQFLYDWFLENDFDTNAMKMLENIERLLGLHSNQIGLSIHNMIEKKVDTSNIYNYNNLTDSEHKRLKQLWQKGLI